MAKRSGRQLKAADGHTLDHPNKIPQPRHDDGKPLPKVSAGVSSEETPYNAEVERDVLAAMILYPDYSAQGVAELTAASFYVDIHRRIFTAIEAIEAKGESPDLVTLTDHMRTQRMFRDEADVLSVFGVANDGTSVNFDAKVDILNNYQARRDLISIGRQVVSQAQHGTAGVDAIVTMAGKGIHRIETRERDSQLANSLAIMERYAHGEADMPTGWPTLDNQIGGIPGADLTVIGGRTGSGKSQTIYPLATHFAKQAQSYALIISPDNPEAEILAMEASRVSRVPLSQLRMKDAAGAQMVSKRQRDTFLKAGHDLKHSFLKLVRIHSGRVSVSDVERLAIRAARDGTCAIFLDTMQRVQHGREGKTQMLGELGSVLKGIGIDYKIPVVGLSQISRDVDTRTDPRPTTADLDYAKTIEDDANLLLLGYRHEKYFPSRQPISTVEYLVAKHKSGRAGYWVTLGFEKEFGRVFDFMNERMEKGHHAQEKTPRDPDPRPADDDDDLDFLDD